MLYSPSAVFRGKDKLQAFTAIGRILPEAPYAVDTGGGFVPFRRNVAWWPAQLAPIQPLLAQLDFAAGNKQWGYQLRFGLFRVSAHDMAAIAQAMGVDLVERDSPADPRATA